MVTLFVAFAFVFQLQAEPLDASAFREKLQVLSDGHGHFIALDPEVPYSDHTFSGDGKQFVQLPISGGGKNGTESFSIRAWDPRAQLDIEMADSGGKYSVTCGKKTTSFNRQPVEEAKALLASATFLSPTWKRRPEKLLRDDKGTYYFVDRFRSKDDGDRRDFRVFAGPRGNMKQLALKNIVDDSQGMILSAKNGNLRLITGHEGKWIQGKVAVPLLEVPIDGQTARLIYLDLGPYAGQRLGTPCDDLM